MKVLHIIETLGVGGAERLLVTVLGELSRRGHSVAVVVLKPPMELREDLISVGVEVIELAPRSKWRLLSGALQIAKQSKRFEADIVHSHLFFPSIYLGLAKIMGLIKAPTCLTLHNTAYQKGVNRGGLRLQIRKSLAAFIYRYGFNIRFAVSQATADSYKAALKLNTIRVIHNPVDYRLAREFSSSDFRKNDCSELFKIIVPGRLVHEKGHFVFLESLSILHSRGYDLDVTLAGDGPLRHALSSRILEYPFKSHVRITGVLSHKAMFQRLSDSHIAVIPSLHEGFGLTALEAMSIGLPVVASNAGGLSEVIVNNKTGLSVCSNSPIALADAIEKLILDPSLCMSLGQAGQESAEQDFSLKASVDRLYSYYSILNDEMNLNENH